MNRDSRDCCMIFVDETSRVYPSWDDYIERHQFGEYVVVAPYKGVYNINPKTNKLHFICFCNYLLNKAIQKLDITTTVTSVAASVAVVAGSVVAMPAVVGAAVAAGIGCAGYSIVRGIGKLVDRNQHEQVQNAFFYY